ncbi:hypothetical protein B0A53_04745 [Rhodotorula sp. CCFEE 5036]|nr:hypothetical protein B0A53_04745 [Rhodotorula sp. CCFEE 5036]
MEAYLSSTKPRHASTAARTDSLKPASSHPSTSSSSHRAGSVNPAQGKPRPYESLTDAPKAPASLTSKNMVQGGLRDRNKAIINTLGKEDNPITNSTAYSRTMHIQSCATGHQSGGGGKRWTLHRNAKLKLQAADSETPALKGVIAYINGYTGRDVTNTQLKELVERQGGSFVTVASARVTHIFVTENLSAKKAQHYLEARRKNGTKLVTPEWAIACAERGKRVSEAKYAAPVFNELQESTYAFFSRSSASPAADPPNAPSSPERPGARTRSSYKQTRESNSPEPGPARRTPEPVPAPPSSILLPAAPVSPLRRSPRRSSSTIKTTTTTTSATALLLAEIKAAKAQRSPSRSPASKAAERKRGWCATWECVVESPGSRKRRRKREETQRVEKEKENGVAATKSKASRRIKAKPPSAEEVLVLASSDAEDDSAASLPRAAGPAYGLLTSASEGGTDADADEEEEDEWSLPPSAQRR